MGFGTLVLRYQWIFGTLVLRYPWIFGLLAWVFGTLVPLDLRNPGVPLLLDPRTFGCTEPWLYGTLESSEPWFYGYLGVLNFDFAVLWLVRHLGVRIPEFTVPLDLRILSVLRTLLGCLLRVIWFFGYFLGRMARW